MLRAPETDTVAETLDATRRALVGDGETDRSMANVAADFDGLQAPNRDAVRFEKGSFAETTADARGAVNRAEGRR